ncbi:MAG: NADPH-dependent oxidoreductase [Janthinobacterium lividum]
MSNLTDLLAQRYGANAPDIPLDSFAADPVLATLLGHKSIRHYKPEALPPGTLEMLGAAAQSAASSSNLQVWSVVAVTDPARKAEASKLCGDQDSIRQAPLFLVFCADLSRLTAVSEREALPGAALDYTEMFVTAVIDASLAGQNAAVAAEGMGLGICYIGGARNHPQELAALLNLPPRVVALFGLTVGWPIEDDTSEIKPRLPQSGLIHHETYDSDARDKAVTAYNETMHGFYESQAMDAPGDWSRHSAKRVTGPESLMGREVLKQILEERGFGLK